MDKEIEVLYIDDEINNLLSFKANFRLSCIVHIAQSTVEAEEVLRLNPNIRIIFCDHMMPNELGINFLERIKVDFPAPIRILLTAYANMEILIDSINKGNIYRFIRKPWENEDILSAIIEANKFYLATSLLEKKNQELEQAYRELDKFAYSVSHDLRDPLVGISSAISLAKEFDNLEEIYDILDLMNNSVLKLDAYIDSLKDYYLLRRGELKLEEIDLKLLATNIENYYKIYTSTNVLDFQISVHQNSKFKCDKAVIELILHNLISNSIKYQQKNEPNKKVILDINVENGLCKIVIKDNGIGIPDEHKQNVFKLFFRATSQMQGSGLGLYNVKNALVKLNGDIKLESILNVGTTFTITIPSK
ncbi:sensor histidine kinase [Sphingobacterium rhinopitheci]|uniref:sensor histidine kinase n=1 Tax=Sphingobacterium rhinopitheci TaxID=2781960 RepID=UPI001F516CAB|nr:HAMP domain-containing sensor histidine kinase [Sphingobacterium rhinopitheci]MCI0921322.1 HAMP domain-containing histidine kinase [Sphingobacterium rhinopitheci]